MFNIVIIGLSKANKKKKKKKKKMYIFVADQHEAPSTHIHCCLKTEIFFWFWPTVHMYQVKMAIENASFQKRSQCRGFELAILLHSCGCTKMEVFGNESCHGVEYQ